MAQIVMFLGTCQIMAEEGCNTLQPSGCPIEKDFNNQALQLKTLHQSRTYEKKTPGIRYLSIIGTSVEKH